jgi:cholesterol oxidase
MQANHEHADVVVVGSGFGGSVSAYRFAEAGQSVVLLERGRPYPPNSFARGPADIARNFWDPSEGLQGLFDIWSFRNADGIVSSGLGGGSLIYANVLLRKDEDWFVRDSPLPGGGFENWPVSRKDLDPHYDRVEQMLQPQRYPFGRPPYDGTRKTQAMRLAAEKLGLEWQLPPLAVSFAPQPDGIPVPGAPIPEPSYGNLHGFPRRTCRMCGECDLGCNDGAKNSLDHTYLSAAKHHGADLRDRCEVRSFAPLAGGGYVVTYVVHDPADEGRPTPTDDLPIRRITCKRLVLAAGAFGTTLLLLRNRAAFPGLSSALGTRFSGNGDRIGLALRARHEDGSIRRLDGSFGSVITSAIRVPDEVDGGAHGDRGFYIQDAGYPVFLDWLAELTQARGAVRRTLDFVVDRVRAAFGDADTNVSTEISDVLGSGDFSAGTLPLLAMGREVPDGVLFLDKTGRLDLRWDTDTSRKYSDSVTSTMRNIADALGADFRDSPFKLTQRVITVHPVGGSPMGKSVADGVIDSHGEVFGFPGLYVADGSAMPGPIGPNPSLTIAAFADRLSDHALETVFGLG